MTRLILLILLSILAGMAIQIAARHFIAPAPIAEPIDRPDIAVQLRALSAAAPPDKLWATSFPDFVSTHPGRWVVGHCAEPCLSEPEAAREARSDAADLVWPIVAPRLPQLAADADWIRRRLTADVISGQLDSDTLAEQFKRPYGAVWTESVLLDVSPARIDPLLNSYQSELSERQNHQAKIRQAIAISIVGAWLAYLFLNWLTKGYFTTRLRLSAALVTIVGTALLPLSTLGL